MTSNGKHISPDQGSFVNWVALTSLMFVKKQIRMIPENSDPPQGIAGCAEKGENYKGWGEAENHIYFQDYI